MMRPWKNRQRGVSLIEVMVAMLIALAALLAASQMHLKTREAARLQGMQNRISEDGRFALSMLQRVISQKGYRPLDVTTSGFDMAAALKDLADNSVTVSFVGDGANLIGCDGSSVGKNVLTSLTIKSSDNKLMCGTTAWVDPGDGGSSLVEFKLSYGLDTTGETDEAVGCGKKTSDGKKERDCVADSYVATTTTPDQVVSVRVCLVLRTDTSDAALAGSTYTNCSGTASNAQDNRLYRTFRSTILLRNREAVIL